MWVRHEAGWLRSCMYKLDMTVADIYGSANPMDGGNRFFRASQCDAPHLRIATTAAEREAIYRLRYEVYAVENGFSPPGSADFRAWEDASDAKAAHLYVMVEGKIVGALRIMYGADGPFPEETHRAYDLDRFLQIVSRTKIAIASRFAIKREHRAGPISIQLLLECARLQRQRGVALCFGDSPLTLLRFYTTLGFRAYVTPYHHPVAGTLAPFVFIVGDVDYLRQINSPLVALADMSNPEFDDVTRRLRQLVSQQVPLRSARSHPERFWQEIYAAFGHPAFAVGALARLTEAELRSLLGLSYIVDFPEGRTLLRSGHPATERWLVLSGRVEVDGKPAPQLSLVGGALGSGGRLHSVDAYVGEHGATLLSIDERKLGQLIGRLPAAQSG